MDKIRRYQLFLLLPLIILFIILIMNRNEVGSFNEGEAESKGKIKNWALDYVGVDFQKETAPVKIAILDSGINKQHKEFEYLTFKEYNAVTPGEKIVDDFGHGTAIAGIIAARGIETTGVIQNVIIYDVKVLNDKGEGKIESVIDGIEWSINQDVDIINISFGFTSDKEGLKESIDRAVKDNIIITAAAGNTLGLTVDYPAQYENVLSISSFDKNFQLDPYSAIGKIDYTAPGVDIISTNNKGKYSTFSGTSFSTGYATGAIASIINKEDDENRVHNIKNKISDYVLQIGDNEKFGHGLITLKKEKLKEKISEKEIY